MARDKLGFSGDGAAHVVASDGWLARGSGVWVKRKHHYLKNYCGITATGMKNKWPRRIYLDVMAGPGICVIEDTGEELPGSPLIALENDFTQYVFVEADPNLADALKKRVASHEKASLVRVIPGDWTRAVSKGELDFRGDLVVAFVDPTGISQVPWNAIRRLLEGNTAIDLLMTVHYAMGITLNASNYVDSRSDQTALDRFVDDADWRDWKCKSPAEFTSRVLDKFFNKMKSMGFRDSPQLTVEAEGRPLYRLALFSRHPKADEFWRKITAIDETGQRELNL